MRQLFICTSDAVLAAAGKPQDLTNVAAGTIGMWENDDDSKWLSTAPATDFSIAYGRPNSQAVVIPIDVLALLISSLFLSTWLSVSLLMLLAINS